jgi:hypothetical protein
MENENRVRETAAIGENDYISEMKAEARSAGVLFL